MRRSLHAAITSITFNLGICFAQTSPSLHMMDQGDVKYLEHQGTAVSTILDLRVIRDDPSVLEDKGWMEYFVMLNNCRTTGANLRAISQGMISELDYPQIAAAYRAKAAELAAQVGDVISIRFDTYPGQRDEPEHLILGEYNMSGHSFPFVGSHLGKPEAISYAHFIPGRGEELCSGGIRAQPVTRDYHHRSIFPPPYAVIFDPISFSAVHVDEATARTFINSTGNRMRQVDCILKIQILPGAPEKHPNNDPTGLPVYVFKGKVIDATIVSEPGPKVVWGAPGSQAESIPLGVAYHQ